MKNKLKPAHLAILCITLLALSGCADSVSLHKAATMHPVGFWHGMWHGMILPFAWVVSLFDSGVAIYATYNNGGWYDFGFVLGVSALGGGTTSGRR
jgi:hypothetical protein